MKRYIQASWNGIVPVSKILKYSDLMNKEQAQLLKEWIYQQGLDVGYSHLDDFLESIDLDAEYAEMLEYKENYPDRWERLMGHK